MATIVIHKNTGNHYILIGTSYSYYRDSRPSFFGGNLFPHEEEGEFSLAAVCSVDGMIGWFPTRELSVVEIGGDMPSEVLQKYYVGKEKPTSIKECTECGKNVRYFDRECPNCGCVLIEDDTEE